MGPSQEDDDIPVAEGTGKLIRGIQRESTFRRSDSATLTGDHRHGSLSSAVSGTIAPFLASGHDAMMFSSYDEITRDNMA
jgi:hypothetical protein